MSRPSAGPSAPSSEFPNISGEGSPPPAFFHILLIWHIGSYACGMCSMRVFMPELESFGPSPSGLSKTKTQAAGKIPADKMFHCSMTSSASPH